jgi:hypothetical protein
MTARLLVHGVFKAVLDDRARPVKEMATGALGRLSSGHAMPATDRSAAQRE